MCRHCSADPSFRGFDLRVSPLGAPVVFTARRCLPFRRLPLGGLTLPLGELAFGFIASAFRHAPLRGCPRRVGSSAFRFGDCRSAGWPSGSRLPLFGMRRFGVAARWVGASARRVDLRAHDFRFSARTASGLPLGELVLPPSVSGLPSASWFFCLSLRGCRWASWPSGSRLPLFGTHRFGVALGELVLLPSVSEIAARRVGLRAHDFRFSACAASGLPLGGLALLLGGLTFGLTTSAFRHAPLRGCRSASWPSGSLLPFFGTHRSAPPRRRSEDRRSTPTRHLFHFKTLISTC